MELRKFKEKNPKKVGIIVFTISCILLISGVILYRTFAIFQVNETQNMIEGNIQDEGDIRFMVYIDDVLQKDVPSKDSGYSLDTSTSYCENGDLISWNDEKWSVELKNISTTKTKCYLKFKQIYKEGILNNAIPDLMNGRLVPVVISETEGPNYYVGNKGGKVKKADITNEEEPWYNYSNKQWANAVILKNGVADNYKPGDEIPEENIESYFVWIPRYSYVLQDSEDIFNSYSNIKENKGQQADVQSFYNSIGGNKAKDNGFEIEFGSKDKEISTTLLSKGTSIVHPAFTTFDSNGFWVGKFETGYNQNSDGSVMPASAESWNKEGAEKNNEESTKVIIKPNVYSWRNINVSNAFYTSYNYKRELESHMMKNTEWGAVAYLTHSKYGRCDKDNKNCEEVRINNVENYITGSSSNFEPTCGYTNSKEECNYYETINRLYMDGGHSNNYYNQESRVASTTGNYSGVYDMSGGTSEYVMGVMQGKNDNSKEPASGRDKENNSGFKGPYSSCKENGGAGENCNDNTSNTTGKGWSSSKYYDLYDYKITTIEYQRGILGDATKEMGPFYSTYYKSDSSSSRIVGSYNADLAGFVNASSPWFVRSGSNRTGANAGIFAFNLNHGNIDSSVTFRIILIP